MSFCTCVDMSWHTAKVHELINAMNRVEIDFPLSCRKREDMFTHPQLDLQIIKLSCGMEMLAKSG